MKKILFVILSIGTFFWFGIKVNAESFIEGDFINGEYITKDKGNSHLYVTMQFITTGDGDIVYCLEPFVTFFPGSDYNEIVGDLSSYSKLSMEQIKRIELLSYYGYGYNSRKDSKWYAITQYLIWKTVDQEASFSFTNTLNGTKISKYESEIEAIERDIKNRGKLAYSKEFIVNYNDTLKIDFLKKPIYEVVNSDYLYVQKSTGYVAENVKENGTVSFIEGTNYYSDKIKIYDNSKNQDLLKPGNISKPVYDINVIVQKGDFTLNILKNDDVYTIESNFSNTCYEINSDAISTFVVCTGDEEMTYKSEDLPYGNYEIRQISNGTGFVKDQNIYTFTIDKANNHPIITINNYLIKNTIDILKYACKNETCSYEDNAIFTIKDKNGNFVDRIITDSKGIGSYVLGYGLYNIEQEKGLDGYTLIKNYTEKIVDETSPHSKVLYNNFIEEELKDSVLNEPGNLEEVEVLKEEENEEIIEPPKTSVDVNLWEILFNILYILSKLLIVA